MDNTMYLLKNIIKEIINNEEIEIGLQTNLINDIGMDSITFMTFIIRIEETFNIELPDEFFSLKVLSNIKSVVEIISILNSKGGDSMKSD